ncbi:DUF928 domain-containing protein [Phormidium sp. CLA17]|uniref:DUF928 domain-containing protein n=1 Tax=Leptolyngbya sp. Cla-17 TaxID=2803751 RepID=UPI0014909D2C|nr:DUF928 domain-containing protein [Leptolyngbya sp. Cla-17]MBM0740878.1 DUF928 domain-containing protein [Leptolyngbya sp. Cla-17]
MRGIHRWNLKVAIALISSMAIQLDNGNATVPIQPIQLASVKIAQKPTGNVRLVRRVLKGPAPGGRYRGGGSRNIVDPKKPLVCPNVQPALTALVPFEEQERSGSLPPQVNVWSFTTAAHPTLWFYMPYTKTQAIPTTLSLVDDDSLAIVLPSTPIQLPNKPGIMAVRIPTSAELKVGKRYRWALTLNCASDATMSDKIQPEGVIVRETPSAAAMAELAIAKGVQRAGIYAKNGFWHDALTILAELRQQDFADTTLKSDWQSLLDSMMLSGSSKEFRPEELADQPFAK